MLTSESILQSLVVLSCVHQWHSLVFSGTFLYSPVLLLRIPQRHCHLFIRSTSCIQLWYHLVITNGTIVCLPTQHYLILYSGTYLLTVPERAIPGFNFTLGFESFGDKPFNLKARIYERVYYTSNYNDFYEHDLVSTYGIFVRGLSPLLRMFVCQWNLGTNVKLTPRMNSKVIHIQNGNL